MLAAMIWFGIAFVITASASPSQYCYKADQPVVIDGKLNEKVWQDSPPMVFRGLVDGKDTKFATTCRFLWDDQFIYMGYEAEETNAWATLGPDTPNPTDFSDKNQRPLFIMSKDTFFKIYLDPDADGKRYIEQIQTNSLTGSKSWARSK